MCSFGRFTRLGIFFFNDLVESLEGRKAMVLFVSVLKESIVLERTLVLFSDGALALDAMILVPALAGLKASVLENVFQEVSLLEDVCLFHMYFLVNTNGIGELIGADGDEPLLVDFWVKNTDCFHQVFASLNLEVFTNDGVFEHNVFDRLSQWGAVEMADADAKEFGAVCCENEMLIKQLDEGLWAHHKAFGTWAYLVFGKTETYPCFQKVCRKLEMSTCKDERVSWDALLQFEVMFTAGKDNFDHQVFNLAWYIGLLEIRGCDTDLGARPIHKLHCVMEVACRVLVLMRSAGHIAFVDGKDWMLLVGIKWTAKVVDPERVMNRFHVGMARANNQVIEMWCIQFQKCGLGVNCRYYLQDSTLVEVDKHEIFTEMQRRFDKVEDWNYTFKKQLVRISEISDIGDFICKSQQVDNWWNVYSDEETGKIPNFDVHGSAAVLGFCHILESEDVWDVGTCSFQNINNEAWTMDVVDMGPLFGCWAYDLNMSTRWWLFLGLLERLLCRQNLILVYYVFFYTVLSWKGLNFRLF